MPKLRIAGTHLILLKNIRIHDIIKIELLVIEMTKEIKNKKDFEPIIHELNSKLKKKYDDFVGITFFGSRYRGDFSSDSDFDIVILFSRKPGWKKESDVLGLVLDIELKYDIIIDAKVYHETEIKKENTPFRVSVMREGAYYGA